MKEENKGTPKNKWSQLYRKKWFFPAIYLLIAAVLVSVVVWYQGLDNQAESDVENNEEASDVYTPNLHDENVQPVIDQHEVVKMPVNEDVPTEIVTKYFDYDASDADNVRALVHYNNRYYQSTGIDITSEDGETFEVVASLSGTVKEVKEDPLLGNVIVLDHGNDIATYYASLGEINVQEGAQVQQGDLLGTSGKNIFGKDNGTHVHFELRKDGKEVNPEEYFNQPISQLQMTHDDEEEKDEDDETENQDEEDNEDTTEDDSNSEDEQDEEETDTN